MRILDRVFGHKESPGETEVEAPECPHFALRPKWDVFEDMGKPEKVSYYLCESCGESLSPEEAKRYQEKAPERVRLDEEQRKG